ncbi:MAG: RNA polymerase sporulation sigma factor SigE [Clostridia bacterium]|nr:RNA polymerase sporulation sigma factor SigE [Clostridia bacterium]
MFFRALSVLFKKIKGFFKSLFSKNELYYVNGTETLPPPLSEEEEEEMVNNLEYQYARDKLIEHNLRLVVYIAKRFENTGAGIEELISIGTVGLIKAISTFKKDKNIKLATYASRCIENEILMFIRKNASQRREVSIDEPLSVDWDGNELLLSDVLGSETDVVSRGMEEAEEKKILREAVKKLNEREKVIIEMRYGLVDGNELTQKEVADALGISQSYISRLEKKIMVELKKKIEEKI